VVTKAGLKSTKMSQSLGTFVNGVVVFFQGQNPVKLSDFPQDELEWALMTNEARAEWSKALVEIAGATGLYYELSTKDVDRIESWIKRYCEHTWVEDYHGYRGWVYCETCRTSQDI
jgi:hypothetical protein